MIVVVVAVIVFGFSLEGQQGPLSTSLSPNAFNGPNAFAVMNLVASHYPDRRPGSVGDDDLASYVASQFRQSDLVVATSTFQARTVDGTRTLETVTGTSPGTSSGSIVIVAHRDALGSPATAELSGTATLLGLANALSGETHSHAIVLASTSGSAGAAGAAQLARNLQGPVDAVIALGDLAGSEVREPIIVPWSGDESLAPPMLRNTLAAAVGTQAGVAPGSDSLGGQFAHLAQPLALGEQAPFGALGYPAVLLSLSGVHEPGPHEVVRDAARITALGQAVLQAISALDSGPPVPAPSAYLVWNGNVIPAWALRVLVLALLAPVVITALDGAARARRRGHRIMPWLAWVGAGALPFALALLVLLGIRYAGLIKALPAGPVSGGAVPPGTAGVVILSVLALVLVASFAALRPFVLRRIGDQVQAEGRNGASRRRRRGRARDLRGLARRLGPQSFCRCAADSRRPPVDLGGRSRSAHAHVAKPGCACDRAPGAGDRGSLLGGCARAGSGRGAVERGAVAGRRAGRIARGARVEHRAGLRAQRDAGRVRPPRRARAARAGEGTGRRSGQLSRTGFGWRG